MPIIITVCVIVPSCDTIRQMQHSLFCAWKKILILLVLKTNSQLLFAFCPNMHLLLLCAATFVNQLVK